MFYIVYEITNLINDKTYIGCHKTDDIEDDYMGSGKILNRAMLKYGVGNFKREILEVFDSSAEMFELESELVNDDFVKRDDTYNLKMGGFGGFDYINASSLNNSANNGSLGGKQSQRLRRDDPDKISAHAARSRWRMKEFHRAGKASYDNFEGMTHTDASKRKMSTSSKGTQTGTSNSQYGTCWVYNLELTESKKINAVDLDIWIDRGWLKGRKLKF